MLDITVKTLDGRNHSFSVADDITVRQFKDEIAQTIAIDAAVQRLIFQGKVLADEKKINEYNVNGKTIHVVQRPPPQSRPANDQLLSDEQEGFQQGGNSLILGPITVQSDGTDPSPSFENIFQQVFGAIAGNRNATRQEGSNGGPNGAQSTSGGNQEARANQAEARLGQASRMLQVAKFSMDKLENSSTVKATSEPSSHLDEDTASALDLQPSNPTIIPMHQPPSTSTDSSSTQNASSASPETGESSSATRVGESQITNSQNSAAAEPQAETLTTNAPESGVAVDPPVGQLAGLLDEMLNINSRLQMHIIQFRDMLLADPDLTGQPSEVARCQMTCDLTSKAMHSLGHAMHNISDLIIDYNAPPPRTLRANAMPLPHPTAIIQQTIPVQVSAQFNVSAVPMDGNHSNPTSSAATTTATPMTAVSSAPPTLTSTPFGPQNPIFLHGGNFFPPNHFGGIRPRAPFNMQFEMFGPHTPTSQPTNSQPTSQTNAQNINGPPPFFGRGMGGAPPGFPPPDFLQNIIQMATGAALRTGGNQMRGPTPQVFMMSSNGNLDSLNVDQNTRTAPTASSQAASAQEHAASTGSNQPPANAAFNQHAAAGMQAAMNMMSQQLGGMLQTTTNQQTQTSQTTSAGQAPVMTQAPSFANLQMPTAVDPFLPCQSRHFATRRTNQQNGEPLAGFVSNLVSSMMNTENVGTNSSNTGQQNISSETVNSPEVNPVLSRLMQSVVSQMTQDVAGQQQPISTFVETMGHELNIDPGEGLFADIFRCVTSHLTFSDLLGIYLGQTQMLDRIRQPLATFVSQRILHLPHHSVPTSDAAISSGIEEIIDLTRPQINYLQESAPLQRDVNFSATIVSFQRQFLHQLISHICNSTSNDGFGSRLYTLCHEGMQDLISLTRLCINGGNAAIEQLIRNLFMQMLEGTDGAWQLMEQALMVQVRQFISVTEMREHNVAHFIVRQTPSQPPVGHNIHMEVGNSPTSSGSFQSLNSEEEVVEHMEFDEQPILQHESIRRSSLRPRLNADLLARLPKPPTEFESKEFDPAEFGSEDWHAVVPREWVPVIMRDSMIQHRQGVNPPLSEAYMAGVPTKRRKMMKSLRRPDLANVHVAFPEAVQKAVADVGATPTTSAVRLAKDLAEDEQLATAFQHEVESRLQQRLRTDPNYSEEKYPAAAERFAGK